MKKLFNYSLLILLFSFITFACSKSELDDLAATSVVDAKSAPKTRMDTPMIECGGSTQVSINITVTAGATGAPAGFSLQWMTAEEYAAGPDRLVGTPDDNTWYASDDLSLCKGSFSGNANLSRYNLKPGESVTVSVGEFLFDNGASSNCIDALECGTQYIFRAFAHANSSLQRSEFTPNLTCATRACGATEEGQCTYTQGFWKNHGPVPTGNNSNMWPLNSMVLGTVTYSDVNLLAVLKTPAQGNGLIALAHQLIAAKLNLANGSAVADAIKDADILIGDRIVPPVGNGFLKPDLTSSLTDQLARYNEGATGPGHCGN